MNLVELFQIQKVLRDRINYREPDRFQKLVLALLVELGECANEWRGFKFWSKDQEPRTCIKNPVCTYCDEYQIYNGDENPLLEELVDGLHFVLEIGLELGYQPLYVQVYKYENITRQFKELYWEISSLEKASTREDYLYMVQKFVGLGEMLGFTREQITQAYLIKNEINHKRQDSGY